MTVTFDDPEMPLLYVLRDNLGLHGPRFGCGLGQCGACTVHIDGAAIRSCVTPSRRSSEQKIVTLEGLGTLEKPHPLQKAFIDEQAAQCGYCINGMIMEAPRSPAKNNKPSERDIKTALRQQSLSLRRRLCVGLATAMLSLWNDRNSQSRCPE